MHPFKGSVSTVLVAFISSISVLATLCEAALSSTTDIRPPTALLPRAAAEAGHSDGGGFSLHSLAIRRSARLQKRASSAGSSQVRFSPEGVKSAFLKMMQGEGPAVPVTMTNCFDKFSKELSMKVLRKVFDELPENRDRMIHRWNEFTKGHSVDGIGELDRAWRYATASMPSRNESSQEKLQKHHEAKDWQAMDDMVKEAKFEEEKKKLAAEGKTGYTDEELGIGPTQTGSSGQGGSGQGSKKKKKNVKSKSQQHSKGQQTTSLNRRSEPSSSDGGQQEHSQTGAVRHPQPRQAQYSDTVTELHQLLRPYDPPSSLLNAFQKVRESDAMQALYIIRRLTGGGRERVVIKWNEQNPSNGPLSLMRIQNLWNSVFGPEPSRKEKAEQMAQRLSKKVNREEAQASTSKEQFEREKEALAAGGKTGFTREEMEELGMTDKDLEKMEGTGPGPGSTGGQGGSGQSSSSKTKKKKNMGKKT